MQFNIDKVRKCKDKTLVLEKYHDWLNQQRQKDKKKVWNRFKKKYLRAWRFKRKIEGKYYPKKLILIKDCKNCKKEFETTNVKRMFCNYNCIQRYNYRKKNPLKRVECHFCSKKFKQSRTSKVYCSLKCKNIPKIRRYRLKKSLLSKSNKTKLK